MREKDRMRHSSVRMILAGCLLMLAACDRGPDNDRLDELERELEQLENEIGRLEFRIYELENPEYGPSNDGDKESTDGS